jgi:hypothetical protein
MPARIKCLSAQGSSATSTCTSLSTHSLRLLSLLGIKIQMRVQCVLQSRHLLNEQGTAAYTCDGVLMDACRQTMGCAMTGGWVSTTPCGGSSSNACRRVFHWLNVIWGQTVLIGKRLSNW